MSADEHDDSFARAARKVLFRKPTVLDETVERPSAAAGAERHLRVKVTINLDGDVVSYFKNLSRTTGRPYQVLMNEALRSCLDGERSDQITDALKLALLSDETFLEEIRRKIKTP